MSPFKSSDEDCGTSPMTQMTDFSCLISEIFEAGRSPEGDHLIIYGPIDLFHFCGAKNTANKKFLHGESARN